MDILFSELDPLAFTRDLLLFIPGLLSKTRLFQSLKKKIRKSFLLYIFCGVSVSLCKLMCYVMIGLASLVEPLYVWIPMIIALTLYRPPRNTEVWICSALLNSFSFSLSPLCYLRAHSHSA